MAIYHFSAQIISRSKGHSAVAAAAYRAGQKLENLRTGEKHDYTRKMGVVFETVLTPVSAPEWARDRGKLWNEVELAERRKDAQLAREINIALPRELTGEQDIELICDFVEKKFVQEGMIADVTIHNNRENSNPHAHVMLTTRAVNAEGFGKKNRAWNDRKLLQNWRENWALECNRALERQGFEQRIDSRSLEAQGIQRPAQLHLGKMATALERRGIDTDIGNINRAVKELKTIIQQLEIISEREDLELQQEGQEPSLKPVQEQYDPWAASSRPQEAKKREKSRGKVRGVDFDD